MLIVAWILLSHFVSYGGTKALRLKPKTCRDDVIIVADDFERFFRWLNTSAANSEYFYSIFECRVSCAENFFVRFWAQRHPNAIKTCAECKWKNFLVSFLRERKKSQVSLFKELKTFFLFNLLGISRRLSWHEVLRVNIHFKFNFSFKHKLLSLFHVEQFGSFSGTMHKKRAIDISVIFWLMNKTFPASARSKLTLFGLSIISDACPTIIVRLSHFMDMESPYSGSVDSV